MDTVAVSAYVRRRLESGAAKAAVTEELAAVGWTAEEIEAAYRGGVVALGAPVPTEGERPTLSRQSSTVDIIINFFSFILLGIVATALGTLFFQVIDIFFPDPLDRTGWYDRAAALGAIHYSIAALLIAFPCYYFALRLWFRKFREDEGRNESRLSKWLTYLVLLASAVTIVGDLIAVVFTFLQGELSVRFFFKALTILVLAGAIFGFYYLERRKIQYHRDIPRRTFQMFGRGTTLLIVCGIVLGFLAGGSPETARQLAFDRTRAEHLASLASCIEQYAGSLGALPPSLGTLKQSSQFSYCAASMQDPETAAPYTYRIVTASQAQGAGRVGEFELCADFSRASDSTSRGIGVAESIWYEHGAGQSCDRVTAQLLVPGSPNGAVMPSAPLPSEKGQ